MKTRLAAHLAWRSRAALGRLAADDSAHCRIVTKTFGVVHILVASETAERQLPQQADRRYAIIWFSLAGLPLIGFPSGCAAVRLSLPDVGFWQIVLQKSFWVIELNF
jgi:hypothetical protein